MKVNPFNKYFSDISKSGNMQSVEHGFAQRQEKILIKNWLKDSNFFYTWSKIHVTLQAQVIPIKPNVKKVSANLLSN